MPYIAICDILALNTFHSVEAGRSLSTNMHHPYKRLPSLRAIEVAQHKHGTFDVQRLVFSPPKKHGRSESSLSIASVVKMGAGVEEEKRTSWIEGE
jgi:hypothetical protein